MIKFFYNIKIFITSLFLTFLILVIISIYDKEKHTYTLILSSKIYNFNEKIYICSDETDIMFAAYYAIQSYLNNKDKYPKEAVFGNGIKYRKWLRGRIMNFILLKKNYSIFPLSNGKIEVKVYDNRKVNGDILKKDMKEILMNLKNGNYFLDHKENLKKIYEKLVIPDYKIFTKEKIKICEEFFNVLYEDNKNIKNNYISAFIILLVGLYIFLYSINLFLNFKFFN